MAAAPCCQKPVCSRRQVFLTEDEAAAGKTRLRLHGSKPAAVRSSIGPELKGL